MIAIRRLAPFGLALALTALGSGCAEPEDERTVRPSTTTAAATDRIDDSFEMPKADPNIKLDPATQSKCNDVEGFMMWVYSAHTRTNREPADVQRVTKGLRDFQDKVTKAVPDLATAVKALADNGAKVLQQPPRAGVTLSAEVGKGNAAIKRYLKDICKMVGSR